MFVASAPSRLKRGDELLACLSASIRRFASWKLATTFLRSQEIRLEDALAGQSWVYRREVGRARIDARSVGPEWTRGR
jgi:hypothetical protein